MTTGTLHAITIVCHTIVLLAIIVAAVILDINHQFDANAIAFLATLGGITGSGLVINGRKVGTEGRREND